MEFQNVYIQINFLFFFPAKGQKITIEEQLQGKEKPTTQFKRIIDVLGIDMFAASTSQAKGRIERLFFRI